ncbi:hypothetical protein Y1Q_0017974 [Alligator mississippiensis]|uniref:Uncharacterized protein n=1 Tax=Alligator mississippiensis TaxID=8496 RepID=A0A151MXU7_ALLMI|nr:hypothetical protein Y1Q_0017974 [Alligator mississippiensis]
MKSYYSFHFRGLEFSNFSSTPWIVSKAPGIPRNGPIPMTSGCWRNLVVNVTVSVVVELLKHSLWTLRGLWTTD